jgi:DDE family transposase
VLWNLKPETIMDDQLLRHLYHRLFSPGKCRRAPGCIYSECIIVLVHFLAVVRERSMSWAHRKSNWPLWMRRLECPSYSQLMRRLKTKPVRLLIAQLNLEFRNQLPSGKEKFCDGKPLVVGGFSKDPDAHRGKLPGDGWGRGYKVHVIVDACGAVDLFTLTGLDGGEPTAAAQMVPLMNLSGVILRGDSNYDSNLLYAAVDVQGGRLVAPRKKPGTGLGNQLHHVDRLRAIEELEQGPEGLKAHRRHRNRVEQALGHLTNLPFGLSPLPNFVRRRHRVALWVLSKITLYHLYLNLRNHHALAA